MKKIIPALVLSLASLSAMAADGSITFAGKITDNTCTIDTNPAGPGFVKAVKLPTVNKSNFTAAGSVAGQTMFSLEVAACDADTVRANFEAGTTVDLATGRLITQGDSAARADMQIEILNAAQSPINLATNDGNTVTTLTGTTPNKAGEIIFFARYYATQADVAVGAVTSSVSFVMDYN